MRPRREPAERFAKMDDNALLARRAVVLDRMARDGGKTGNYSQWAREDLNCPVHANVRSGTAISNAVGRAIGRLRDDSRIVEELDQELSDRHYSVEEIREAYDAHCADLERAAIQAGESTDRAMFAVDSDGEVVIEPTAPDLPAPTPTPARRTLRDRLAWVPLMQQLARKYAVKGRE